MYIEKATFQRVVFVMLSIILGMAIALISHNCTCDCADKPPVVEYVYIIKEVPVVVEEPEPEIEYYDVPLSEELQEHIFKQCEERGVDPTIVLGMIKKESNFRAEAMGDYSYERCSEGDEGALLVGTDINVSGFENGTYVKKVPHAYGLMQIWPKWHSHRMKEYGCSDLRDPFQNVTVGIDIIADYIDRGKGVEWALMAYNGGGDYATKKLAAGEVSAYARGVLDYAKSLKGDRA